MNIFIILGGLLFVYALIVKPEVIATLFFIITIADINYEVPGLPLNPRAIVGLALFARTLIAKRNEGQPGFLSNTDTWMVVGFTLYSLIITAFWELANDGFMKQAFMSIIAVYCGHYYYWKTKDYRYLRFALIISGFICLFDLVFTYKEYGVFPVARIYQMLLNVPIELDEQGDRLEIINHNFYGLICGMCFVMLINEFINKKSPPKYILLVLPCMFLGVLMSTSRSTLLGLIAISLFLIARELKHRERAKKAYSLIALAAGILILCLFVFTAVQSSFNLEAEFADRITARLVDEPVAVFRKHLGMNYNANALNALDWREEASADAYKAFLNLRFHEQIFGIGYNGYRIRNLGHQDLPPHNGILMLVIEHGIVMLAMYTIMIVSILRKSFKRNTNIAPIVTTLIFVIFYCLGQNGELTTSITFLFIITLIAENERLNIEQTTTEIDESSTEDEVVLA